LPLINSAGLSQELEGVVFTDFQFSASVLFLSSRGQPQTSETPLSRAAASPASGNSLARLDERQMSSESLQSPVLARRTSQLFPSTLYQSGI
jgi:hypothetical protein